MPANEIWTIGHSTRELSELIEMLRSFQIQTLVDVRSYPGSRRFPQFNKEALEISMPENDFEYKHLKDLGGRRSTSKDSKNTAWRLKAFMGYADYMETEQFKDAVNELAHMATKSRVAYMCAEAVWWSCHRSMISDYLKSKGWKVMHIMAVGKAEEHPYTSPAKIIDNELSYREQKLF